MGKGPGKSSATSATRKKHAKKHAPPPEEPAPRTKKEKKARGKKEPKQKIYIPPVKPAPVQPDPLETTGLAHSLPPELLVVLRSFNKKAEVTKIRALEELQAGWVDKSREDEMVEYNLVQMLPVWLHHAPSLFLHPSRRVRALTAVLHLSLVQIAAVKERLLFFLREMASTAQVESLLGSWCVAAHDVDKTVALAAMKSWKDPELQPDAAALLEFVQRTALDPAGIYAYLNPIQPSVAPPSHPGSKKRGPPPPPRAIPEPRGKVEEESEENEQDRKARLRFGALGALRWMLESLDPLPEGLLPLFGNPALLTSVQSNPRTPGVDIEAFGYGQPAVRRNMWTLLQILISRRKGQLQEVASELARAVLRSAFVETDSTVQSAMWYPLLLFLKECPHSWELEVKASQEEDDDEDDDSPRPPPTASVAYAEFLQFLQLGCSGSPVQGYPTVVVILSTIPPSIIATSSPTPLDDLFTSFWAALDGRALSSLDRQASSAALLSSLLECMILILKRLDSATLDGDVRAKLINGGEGAAEEFSMRVVKEQSGRMWKEIVDGKLRVPEEEAAKNIVKTVGGLKEIGPELSNAAWDTLTSSIHASSLTHSSLVARLAKELQNETRDSEEWQAKLNTTIAKLAEQSLEGYTTAAIPEEGEPLKQRKGLLVNLFNTFKHGLFSMSDAFRTQLDALFSDEGRAYELLKTSPHVFLAVLGYRGFDTSGRELAQTVWRSVLGHLAKPETSKAERDGLLKVLVDAAKGGALPEYLRVYEGVEGEGALDDLVGQTVVEVVGGQGDGVDVLQDILGHHGFFVSTTLFLGIFETICGSLASEIGTAFEDPFFQPSGSADTGAIPWSAIEALFSLVLSTYTTIVLSLAPYSTSTTLAIDALAPYAFLFAYLLPLCEGIEEAGRQRSFELAKEVWERWFKDALETGNDAEKGKSRASVGLKEVRERLKGFILGTKTRVLPQTVLTLLLTPGASRGDKAGADQFFLSAHPEFSTDTTLEFLPCIAELDSMLAFLLPSIAPNSSMGVLEPIAPPSTAYPYSAPARTQSTLPSNAVGDAFSEGRYGRGDVDVNGYDRYGYSAYARAVSALVSVFARDRACVRSKEGVEMLRHAAALEVCAWDALCLPSALGSAGQPQKVFGESVPLKASGDEQIAGATGDDVWSLTEIISKVEQVSTYAFITTGGREPWKRYVVESLAGATAKVSCSTSDAPTMDERGDLVTGGVKKTIHATMNRLSFFVLEVVGRSVQAEVDLKDGVTLSPSINDQRSAKDKVKSMKSLVVLRARVLRRVLERVFDDDEDDDHGNPTGGMHKEEVDAWVGYARRVERIAPLTSSTILATLTSLGLDSPRFDRARNEFAASLLGVQPPKANTEGLELIRVLGLCVPKDESEDDGFTARMTTGSNGVNLGGRGGSRRGGSDVIMLPVQRAVNVVRACQNWVEGRPKASGDTENEDSEDDEEGPSEDLESAMLGVFVGLAPILQNVIGKHWEFMWDVVETVLENSTLEDESTLLGLSHALKFVKIMEELVHTNKQLRAEWNSRRISILGSIKDLLLEEEDVDDSQGVRSRLDSIPRSVCRELILSIVQSLPDVLMNQDTLGKMCHLASDPSIEVQRLSYAMLRRAAEKRTEWVVIEVGVGGMGEGEGEPGDRAAAEATDDDSGQVVVTAIAAVELEPAPRDPALEEKPKRNLNQWKSEQKRRKRGAPVVKSEGPSLLPKELLAIIQRDEQLDLFGWMLGWMLVFDLFKDASFKVKSMYIEQLRNLDLVGKRLLPAIVRLLRLDNGPAKAVKVNLWAVDEFYVAYYDPISAPALAAHLYYRALLSVRSLINTWVSGCKDRLLTNALTALTSAQFSPLIIRTELAHLKSPEGVAELSGDGLTVKVIGGKGSTVGGEVVAAYLVDDHQLELHLRIPSDWPLHMIDVHDERRVGVDEKRWRSWMMGLHQTIWFRNGRIIDGLSLWKKNVIGHFEGQVECAICYSIISASDGSLPKKPCKTCKNRFHAGCLYKWFNTSHSSSCPLCRSNII